MDSSFKTLKIKSYKSCFFTKIALLVNAPTPQELFLEHFPCKEMEQPSSSTPAHCLEGQSRAECEQRSLWAIQDQTVGGEI